MANLDSTNIIGKLRVSDNAIINGTLKVNQIIDKNNSTGASGYVLKTTGSELYWDIDNASTGSDGTAGVTSISGTNGVVVNPTTGNVTVSANLRSTTKLTYDSSAATTTSGRVYPVALDKSGYLSVNVPWVQGTDTQVSQTYNNADANRPILCSSQYTNSNTSGSAAGVAYWKSNVYVNMGKGQLGAHTITASAYYVGTTDISTLYAAAGAQNSVKLPIATTANGSYFVTLSGSTVGTEQITNLNRSDKLKFNPSTGVLTATSLTGNVTGNLTGGVKIVGITGTDANYKLYFWGTRKATTESAPGGDSIHTPYINTGCYIKHNRYYAAGTSVGFADYAEFFEWADGNLEVENRLGLFVSFSEECPKQIRIATPEDEDILGIVSAQPAILGNCAEDEWVGKYERDIWGRVITETVEVPATYDEQGNEIEAAYTVEEPKLSTDFDPDREYTPRGARAEWAPIGLLGVLVMIDDGTCIPGCYCKCGEGGVATFSPKGGWRVLERLDDTHVRVYFK